MTTRTDQAGDALARQVLRAAITRPPDVAVSSNTVLALLDQIDTLVAQRDHARSVAEYWRWARHSADSPPDAIAPDHDDGWKP